MRKRSVASGLNTHRSVRGQESSLIESFHFVVCRDTTVLQKRLTISCSSATSTNTPPTLEPQDASSENASDFGESLVGRDHRVEEWALACMMPKLRWA